VLGVFGGVGVGNNNNTLNTQYRVVES